MLKSSELSNQADQGDSPVSDGLLLLPKKNQSVTVTKISQKTSSTLLQLPNSKDKVRDKVRRMSVRLGIEKEEKEEKKEASFVDIPVFVGGKFVLKEQEEQEQEDQNSEQSSTTSGK